MLELTVTRQGSREVGRQWYRGVDETSIPLWLQGCFGCFMLSGSGEAGTTASCYQCREGYTFGCNRLKYPEIWGARSTEKPSR